MKKWIKIVLALIILLLISWAFSGKIERTVANRLSKMAVKKDNNIYHYELGGFELKFFSRELVLKDVKIIPKVAYLDSLKQLKKAKSSVYSIALDEISIQDLNLFSVLFTDHIDLGKIRFESPNIKLYKADSTIAEEDQIVSKIGNQKRLFSDLIHGKFKSINIAEIDINNAKTHFYKVLENDSLLLMKSDNSNFKIYGIATDQKVLNSNVVFNYDSTYLDFRNLQWEANEDYTLFVGRFTKSSDNDHLTIKNIVLEPREDKFTFMLGQVEEVDWYKCEIDEINVLNFDLRAFQRNNSIKTSSIEVNKANIEIYRDKRLRDEKSIKPLIGTILKGLEIDLSIPSLSITDTQLNYYEWEISAKKPIHAEVHYLNISIENMSNRFQDLINSDTLKLNAEAFFMDKGKVELQAEFILSDTNDKFNLYTRVEHIPLKALNPLIKESAFIEFKDGKLDWLEMQMSADDHSSETKLDMQYSNMKHFDLLRGMDEMKVQNEKGHHVSRKRKFLSFIIREVIPNNYGPEHDKYETANYSVKRIKHKSIINYLVENLKAGAKSHLEPDFLKKGK